MRRASRTVVRLAKPPPMAAARTVVGRLVGVTSGGRPLVEHPADGGAPRVARVLDGWQGRGRIDPTRPIPVLLVFDDDDAAAPVLVGTVRDTLDPPPADGFPDGILVDGRRIAGEDAREIVLRCGKASLTLTADGAVIVRGARVVSRSSGVNKIKGASVEIN